jgi:hypothetical protein
MPTYGAIREQIRQALDAGAGERCAEGTLNHLCLLVHALATGQTARLLADLPSDAAREELRQGLALIHEEHADDIRLVRAETARLFAEASRQGLTAEAAEAMVQATLWREFYRQSYRGIRVSVRRKLASDADPPIPVGEATLQRLCALLAHVVFEPSGLTLHLHNTTPRVWNDAGEVPLAYVRQRFAREIALLDGETTRIAEAAEARGMRDEAVRRLVLARLNREFVGRRRRRRP